MNQAQIARPYFWVFLKTEDEAGEDPGIALRLFKDEGKSGISLEVSFIERKLGKNTVENQNKVLNISIKSPLYYYVQFSESNENCVLERVEGTEPNRKKLIRNKDNKEIRKVLVKYDVKNIEQFESLEKLTDELLKGFELLLPYYGQTKLNKK